jgi:hypothetical protein
MEPQHATSEPRVDIVPLVDEWLGVDTWQHAGRPLAALPNDAPGRQVLDLRQGSEFASGHVAGALHLELEAGAGA